MLSALDSEGFLATMSIQAATAWTVPLLAGHLRAQGLAISARTLRRRIRAARFRWKRPRYVYSERAAHVGAKKGALSGG